MKETINATEETVAARFAALPPAERLRMSSAMFESAKRLIAASVRHAEPGLSPAEVRVRIFDRLYGDDFDGPARARIHAALRSGAPDRRG